MMSWQLPIIFDFTQLALLLPELLSTSSSLLEVIAIAEQL